MKARLDLLRLFLIFGPRHGTHTGLVFVIYLDDKNLALSIQLWHLRVIEMQKAPVRAPLGWWVGVMGFEPMTFGLADRRSLGFSRLH